MSDYIPEEKEILKWLPVKSILQCRCVCKKWKETIDSPLFHQHHLALQKPKLLAKYEHPELLILDPAILPDLQSLTLPPPFSDASGPIKPHRLVGTLHGLVCLHDNVDQILIWNPATRKSFPIHAPVFPHEWQNPRNVHLLPYSGFWINPITKHFKIIMFKIVYAPDPCLNGYVYSSTNQFWKAFPLNHLQPFKPCATETPPVVIGEVAYWKTNCIYFDDTAINKSVLLPTVLSFDFASDCFNSIIVPEIAWHLDFPPTLCTLRESLALVSWELRDRDRIDVHVWSESAWVHIMAVEVCISAVFRVAWLLGDTEETCRVIADTGVELVLYDCKEGDDVALKSPLMHSANMFMAYDFVESLLFP